MQKTDTKASIFIWAVFLSLIVITAFLSISTKIHSLLLSNKQLPEVSDIHEYLSNAVLNKDYTQQNLSNNTYLRFSDPTQTTMTLTQQEELSFSGNVNIQLLDAGPITINGELKRSGESHNISHSNIIIKNLGGLAKLNISSNNSDQLEFESIRYKIVRKIAGEEFILQSGELP